jgi:glycosyltransferase involved in cell wall biosynthesis
LGEEAARLKVLLVNTLYTPNQVGGAERFVQILAESLVRAGHQATVISTSPQKGVRTGWISGVKIHYVGLKNFYWPFGDSSQGENPSALKPLSHALDTYNPWMAREAARVLDVEKPDLVHTNNVGGFSVSAWHPVKRRRLPLVHTLHDHYLLCPRTTMFRRGKNCRVQCTECIPYALPRRRLSKQVDAVVGVSRFMMERHLDFGYFTATPVRQVIPNPYATKLTIPQPKVPSLPVRFGYLGRLHVNKGIEVLLEAAGQLRGGTWKLRLAGKGIAAYENRLRTRYESPAVEFLGYVNPEDFFREIDVLVVPSQLRESFGRGVIEAYAHGIPVIGCDRGGVAELIEEGQTGFLFDPDHPDDLRTKMRIVIEDPVMIKEMRSACLRKAKDFVPRSVVEQYLEVYADVLR